MLVCDWPRLSSANDYPAADLRVAPEDFFVDEIMDEVCSGEGEHVWLHIEKRGDNTEYVARQIARLANVRPMDVGFSGLKDRHAVTRQWFSVYLAKKPEPLWAQLNSESVSVLQAVRHSHKLRRGAHNGNRFVIRLRHVQAERSELEPLLARLGTFGFPNYFGEQRFGREGANLTRALSWFQGNLKVSKSQRGFYLSAARSFLFNELIAAYLQDGNLQALEGQGAYYGETRDPDALNGFERALFARYEDLTKGLESNRIQLERRPLRIIPGGFSWQFENNQLTLSFTLPTGVFATSLIREVCDYTDCSPSGRSEEKHETASIE